MRALIMDSSPVGPQMPFAEASLRQLDDERPAHHTPGSKTLDLCSDQGRTQSATSSA